jgi:hypothetical protein
MFFIMNYEALAETKKFVMPMLKINARQFKEFENLAEQKFLEAIHAHLTERHPDFLPRFPEPVQHQIVTHMVARARSTGVRWQSAIAILCDLMESIAPNLLASPHVLSQITPRPDGIETLGSDIADRRVCALHRIMPRGSWAALEQNRDDLSLYTPPEYDAAALPHRLAYALNLVLWDHIDQNNVSSWVEWGMSRAVRDGLNVREDAALATCAWGILYGQNSTQPWEDTICDPVWPARIRLQLLRARIMIDFGRRV